MLLHINFILLLIPWQMLVTFQPSPTWKSMVYSKAVPRCLRQAQDQYICDEWNHKPMQPIFWSPTYWLPDPENVSTARRSASYRIYSKKKHQVSIIAFLWHQSLSIIKALMFAGHTSVTNKLPDTFRQEGVGVWAQNIYGQWDECVAAEVSVASLTLLLNWLGNSSHF